MDTLPRNDKHYNNIFRTFLFFNINKLIFILWISCQIGLFIYNYKSLQKTQEISYLLSTLGNGFLLAKSSALIININLLLIFLSVNKNIISAVYNILPINFSIHYHVLLNLSIALFSTLHIVSHSYNFYILSHQKIVISTSISTSTLQHVSILQNVSSVAGVTGILLICMFLIIYTCSTYYIRKNYYEVFVASHLLYLGIVITLLLHSSFCFLHTDIGACIGSSTWKYITIPFALFLFERLHREYIGHQQTTFLNIKRHHSDCYTIDIYKQFFEFKPGQSILINCPAISKFQWHPFTITSNPIENGHIQICIKEIGTWTKQFTEYLSVNNFEKGNIKLKISKPYGNTYDIISRYRVAVLIAGGIGITSFMSLLKSLPCSLGHGNKYVYLKKVYVYWVCRHTRDFDCFLLQIKNIKAELDKYGDLLELNFFITGVEDIMLKRLSLYPSSLQFTFGRPHFDNILYTLDKNHPNTNIKLLCCGSKSMYDDISKTVHIVNKNINNNSKFIFRIGDMFTH